MDLLNSYNFLELQTHDEKFLKNRYKKIHKDNFYNCFQKFPSAQQKRKNLFEFEA